MKVFHEALRYEYQLTADSVVIEAGTHKGIWAQEMARRYACQIHTFEPISAFYFIARQRLGPYSHVHVYPQGLADSARTETWNIKGEMTGPFNGDGMQEDVSLLCFAEWLAQAKLPDKIDLLEINIEGGEFALLEHIIEQCIQSRFLNIQVQFHPLTEALAARRLPIQNALHQTHTLEYDAPFVWEGWKLKP